MTMTKAKSKDDTLWIKNAKAQTRKQLAPIELEHRKCKVFKMII